MKRGIGIILSLLLLIMCFSGVIIIHAKAADTEETITGELYEFEKNSHYEISAGISIGNTNTNMGTLSVSGNMQSMPEVNGFKAYEVNEGNISIEYALGTVYANGSGEDWYLINDRTKIVDSESLESNILKGAVIVQTSLDAEIWVTDVSFTDIVNDTSYDGFIYTSNNIQQVNGCYYRIIVVYELERESGTNFFGITTHEQKKCAEVYEFYLINSSENASDGISPTATPRRELGSVVNTGMDNGFSGSYALTNDDPHYGWTIGTFFVNGYTRETTYGNSDSPVFLKNVGDRVTLWFNLEQDITCLNGMDNLQISEDEDGYDQYFQTDRTNMRHGTLIIQYTDHEGVKHEPVIYTDYLAANARTGADTRVELFEEGDYEVALDYEIVDTTMIDSYTNYRITFTFSIRNGNCMVYPFDVVSGMELSNGAITNNGFRLDMARTRYLTIDVQRAILVENADGTVSEDIRFNRPANDGETYTEEGIYTFTVNNLYTGEETTKVIYVGENKVLKALSTYEMTIDELNTLILGGTIIEEDGTLVEPVAEEEIVETVVTAEAENLVEEDVNPEEIRTESEEAVTGDGVAVSADVVMEGDVPGEENINDYIGFIIAGIVCITGTVIGVVSAKKKRRRGAETVIPNPEEEDGK